MQLNVYPGLKGLKELLGHVPSWISYEEKERVEVRAHGRTAPMRPYKIVHRSRLTSISDGSTPGLLRWCMLTYQCLKRCWTEP